MLIAANFRVVMAFNIYCYTTWSVTYFNCLLPCLLSCSTRLCLLFLYLHRVIVYVVVLASLPYQSARGRST